MSWRHYYEGRYPEYRYYECHYAESYVAYTKYFRKKVRKYIFKYQLGELYLKQNKKKFKSGNKSVGNFFKKKKKLNKCQLENISDFFSFSKK